MNREAVSFDPLGLRAEREKFGLSEEADRNGDFEPGPRHLDRYMEIGLLVILAAGIAIVITLIIAFRINARGVSLRAFGVSGGRTRPTLV